MKKTKLFTSLVALALVLGLGACDLTEETPDESDKTTETGETSESTEPSESSESSETGDTSESSETGDTGETTPGGDTGVSTLSNYTLSIGISYNGDLVTVPEYATAYIEGGWDNWTEWVSLTESVDGRYEYTFASIAPGTYEYQLVLAPNGQEPGWTYRITPDGGNASFTVTASDGDYYTNEVTVTASKALEEIIPDPDASYSNVKVTIDITYNGASQGVLDYGTLWIEGSWNWNAGFVPCEKEGDKYVYTFDSLAPIEYEFLGVIYYTGESLPTEEEGLWGYKVNNANCTFKVEGTEVTATLVATKALSEILPEKIEEKPVVYKLGALDESVYCYRYFNGTTTGTTFLNTTTEWDDAVEVYITPVDDGIDNSCTLSFDANGNTKYISNSNSTSVTLADDPCVWVWVESLEVFAQGSSSGRVLVLYTDGSFRGYAQSDANLKYPHVYAYTEAQENPEKPAVTTTYEQVSGLGDGGEFYAGGTYNSSLYLTTGKLTNYNLAGTQDLDSAVPFTVTGNATDGYTLTNADGQYVYVYYAKSGDKYYHDFGLSTNATVPNSGTNVFFWNDAASTLYCDGSTIGSTYAYCYFEFYQGNVCGYGTNTLNASTSNLAHFYQQVTA